MFDTAAVLPAASVRGVHRTADSMDLSLIRVGGFSLKGHTKPETRPKNKNKKTKSTAIGKRHIFLFFSL